MGGLFVEYMIRLASVCSRMLCGFLRAITHCSKNCFNSQRKNPQPCSCINFSHLMTKIFLPFKAFAETTREKVEEKEFRLSAKCFKISCSRGKHIWLINASELLNSAPQPGDASLETMRSNKFSTPIFFCCHFTCSLTSTAAVRKMVNKRRK